MEGSFGNWRATFSQISPAPAYHLRDPRPDENGPVGCFAGLLALAALNNILDYSPNFAFVTHVLSMDTTLRRESLVWRAMTSPILHHGVYAIIIVCRE